MGKGYNSRRECGRPGRSEQLLAFLWSSYSRMPDRSLFISGALAAPARFPRAGDYIDEVRGTVLLVTET